MNIESLKGQTIDDATLAKLTEYVGGLQSRADTAEGKARTAQAESISGRKGKDAVISKLMEKLGIDSPDDIDSLPDAKGQAEASKQMEAKLKKMERERLDAVTALQDVQSKYSADKKALAIDRALSAHQFVDMDDARAIFGGRIKSEGDDLLFDSGDGKMVNLNDGAAWLAKNKTYMVKAPTATGSGFKAGAGPASPNAPTLSTEAIYAARNGLVAQASSAK